MVYRRITWVRLLRRLLDVSGGAGHLCGPACPASRDLALRARSPRSWNTGERDPHSEEILVEYPGLQPDDIRAAIAYAADLARERLLPLRESA